MRIPSRSSKSENPKDKKLDLDYWLQRLIACCLSMGISKRDLFNDYYMDEIGEIIFEHNEMHRTKEEPDVEVASCESFFGF